MRDISPSAAAGGWLNNESFKLYRVFFLIIGRRAKFLNHLSCNGGFRDNWWLIDCQDRLLAVNTTIAHRSFRKPTECKLWLRWIFDDLIKFILRR